MRNDDVRFTVNRGQFDNSEQARERMPAVRVIEHTMEYLVLVGWLEAALDTGTFTLDEQLAQLLRGD